MNKKNINWNTLVLNSKLWKAKLSIILWNINNINNKYKLL